MRRRLTSVVIAMAIGVPALVVLAATPAAATVFSNSASITLNDPNSQSTGFNNAVATPYPSTIAVTGLTGTVSGLTVTLSGVTYSFSQDIDALLVGPGGQKFILVSNLGPSGANHAVTNGNMTFSDAGTLPTQATPWGSSSVFKPVNFGGFNQTWPAPAPAPPYSNPGPDTTIGPAGATLGNVFNGTNPNGTWSLYVITTAGGDGTGAIAGGWSLDVTTANAAATTTTLSSNNNPSFAATPGNSVTLTSTVKKTSDSSNVNEGTVAFTDGGSAISGCSAVAVSTGVATCVTTFSTEGNHILVATFGGTANFGQSQSGNLTQVVNNHTTVTGSNFCNSGSLALNDPNSQATGHNNATSTPYPSNIFVSGLAGTVNHVAVTLNNVSYSHSQDIDALLVGPGGQTLILVANLGPNSGAGAPVSNGTVTFSDAGVLPPSGPATPWSALSTVKPVNYGGFNEFWIPPAPAAPYGDPGTAGAGATLASQFNGINGNGTWSLYVITTAGGDGTGAIAGGWCANITAAAAAGSTTTLVSSNNPSFTTAPGNGVMFTATVRKSSDNSNINEGTVTFTDGGSPISGCTAAAVTAGQATCATSFSTQGNHAILAQYNGTANFGPSSANLNQVVNNHTTVTGSNYCNTGSIALNNPPNTVANATPYPSNIFVAGRPGNLLHLAVTLNNTTYSHSQDIDALLVGPSGQTLILVANLGPNSGAQAPASNSTLTLDDAGIVPPSGQTTPWGATSTFKPVNFGGFNEVWGPPAPPGPYGNPGPAGGGSATLGSQFNGSSPNGTWSLYVITTASGDGTGAIAGGWCLNVTTPSPPVLAKAFGAPSVPLNGSTSLSFTVTNPNTSTTLNGIGFTDTLPSGLIVSTPNGQAGPCGGGTITAAAGSSSVTLANAALAGGASCTFLVNVTGTSAGSKVNTTSAISSTEGGSGTAASATLVVVAPPTISKAFTPNSVQVNGTSALAFTLTNPNATSSLSGVGFTDTLPSGLVISTPNGLSGSCGGGTITATAGSSSVTLATATLAGGATCTFSVNVTPSSVGSMVNTTSTVSSNEGGTGAVATAALTVTSGPVQITKSFGAASIPLNGSTTLSFSITNPAANGTSTGIAFTDNLPAGLVVSTPNGLTGSCGGGTIAATAGASTVSLSNATLAGGANCTFSVKVKGTSAGVKNNSVQVSSTNGGTGNTSNASLTVVAPPGLTKAFGATSIALNGTTTLTFTATNTNSTTALTGVGFTDTLPAGLVVATPNGLSGSCGGGTITATAGSSSVALAGATLATNSSCTFSVNVMGTAAGAKVNTTSAVSSNEGGNGSPGTATVTVAAGPPQITKSFGAASIPLNGSTTLSFSITNPAANGTSTGIAFTDNLPAGLVVSTPNGLTGSCGGGTIAATAGASTVSLSNATLAGGANCTFSVNVKATSAGVKSNSVQVSSTNGGTGNTSNASLTVVAPPGLTKAFGAASIVLNGTTTLTFTATNTNSTTALTGVGFIDTLPAGLKVSTPNGLTGSCGGGTIGASPGSGAVTLTGATLPSNGSCTFTVNVTGVSAGTQVNTTGSVTSNEGGTGAPATATVTVVGPPVIAKSFGSSVVGLNASTSLSFTVTNPAANAVSLTGVGFIDTLPAGLVVATPNGLSGSCGGGTITATAGSSTVSLSTATLPVNSTCAFSVNVTGTSEGAKNNSVTVTSTNGGTGNTATATVTVARPPVISKAFGAATIPLNGSTSLSFTISNPNGSFALTGVGFTDSLPAGLVVSTPNGLTGSCAGGTITATAGSGTVSVANATLAGGATCTFSVNVTGSSAGVKNNSVQVSSGNAGPGNTANASVTVVAPPTITKQFGAATIPLNGSTSLAFTVGNPNSTVALTGVGFGDTLPSGLVVSTPNGLAGSCGGGTITATAGSSSIALSGATIPASGSCAFSVNVTGMTAGVQNNTTGAVTSDNGGTGSTASAPITVVAPPVITKTFGSPAIATNGGSTSLTFTITNPNSTVALTGVSFTDTLPAGLVVSTPNGLAGSCDAGVITAIAGSSTVSLSGATLAPSESCTFSVNVTGTSTGPKTNTVTVTSTNGGTGNTSTAKVTSCDHLFTGNIPGAVVLSGGLSCASGATIGGGITVTSGTTALILNSTANGSLNSSGAASITVCGSTLKSSVTITGTTGFVLVGDPGDDACAGNTIALGVILQNNTGGVELGHNQIGGSVNVTHNSGTGPFLDDVGVEIEANKINSSLNCSGDTPPATDGGQPNTITGAHTGECSAPGF